MQTIKIETVNLIGLALPHKTNNANGQSAIDCGNLWQAFEAGNYAASIPAKLDDAIIAVYHDYESDHNGPYSYFIGCRVQPGTVAPAGLTNLLIPQGNYQRITVKGQMPDCVADGWREIWQSATGRAYRPDFEVYDERSKDWKNAEVDIFLSVL